MSEYKLAPYGVKRLIDDAFIPADADNGDWEIYLAWLAAGGQSLPEVTEEEAAATKLGLDTAAEISWQAAEMSLIADQLLRIDDHDPTARPGSEEEWRAYRVKVRAWKEGAAHFPSPTYRPVQPS